MGGDDGLGQRVFAVCLDRGCQGQEPVGITVDGSDAGHAVLPAGERARLVEQDGIDGAHPLQRQAVLDEDAAAGGLGGGDGRDQGDGQPQCMRAGDDEHGDRAGDRVLGLAEEHPRGERHRAAEDGDVEQQGCGTVGEHLGVGTGFLGLGDEPLDAGQRRTTPDRVDPDPQGSVRRDAGCQDPAANGVWDGV